MVGVDVWVRSGWKTRFLYSLQSIPYVQWDVGGAVRQQTLILAICTERQFNAARHLEDVVHTKIMATLLKFCSELHFDHALHPNIPGNSNLSSTPRNVSRDRFWLGLRLQSLRIVVVVVVIYSGHMVKMQRTVSIIVSFEKHSCYPTSAEMFRFS